MDERNLRDEELEEVAGGVENPFADVPPLDDAIVDPFGDVGANDPGNNNGTFYFLADEHYGQIVLENLHNALENAAGGEA